MALGDWLEREHDRAWNELTNEEQNVFNRWIYNYSDLRTDLIEFCDSNLGRGNYNSDKMKETCQLREHVKEYRKLTRESRQLGSIEDAILYISGLWARNSAEANHG